ncbi:hypothetical protein ACP70R_009818 [Stipagrostis hirtigluma subsp. patula]
MWSAAKPPKFPIHNLIASRRDPFMAQPPLAAPAPASRMPPPYLAGMPPGFVFMPKGASLVKHYLVPRALHGRVPDNVIQDGVADGVDVCAARPEALPFPGCNRRPHGVVWAYFFTKRSRRPHDRREKEYVGDDGGVIAFSRRLAFHEAAAADGGGKLTQWRAKEFRLNEAAAAFRGASFHPGAKDLVIWKVYNEVAIPKEPEMDPYYSSSDDDDDNPNVSKKMKITAGGLLAGPAATAA